MGVVDTLNLESRCRPWGLLAGLGYFLIVRKNVDPFQCSGLATFSFGNGDLFIWSCYLSLLRVFTSQENGIFTYSLHYTLKYFGNFCFKLVNMLAQLFCSMSYDPFEEFDRSIYSVMSNYDVIWPFPPSSKDIVQWKKVEEMEDVVAWGLAKWINSLLILIKNSGGCSWGKW